MTPKQERFVQEYLIDLNATQAAIRAGYSEATAKQQGSRLLTNADVQQAVADGQEKRVEKVEIDQQFVVKGLSAIASNGESESARVRSYELLGKHVGMVREQVEVRGALEVSNHDVAAAIDRFTAAVSDAAIRASARSRALEAARDAD